MSKTRPERRPNAVRDRVSSSADLSYPVLVASQLAWAHRFAGPTHNEQCGLALGGGRDAPTLRSAGRCPRRESSISRTAVDSELRISLPPALSKRLLTGASVVRTATPRLPKPACLLGLPDRRTPFSGFARGDAAGAPRVRLECAARAPRVVLRVRPGCAAQAPRRRRECRPRFESSGVRDPPRPNCGPGGDSFSHIGARSCHL